VSDDDVSVGFPYPVLCDRPELYKKSIFNCEISKVSFNETQVLNLEFKSTGNVVNDLIAKKKASYALSVKCPRTMLRRLYWLKASSHVVLDNKDIRDAIDVQAYILAKEDIANFTDPDFDDDFSGMSFNIRKADVLGENEAIHIKINFKNKVEDFESVIDIREGSSDDKFMSADYDGDHIEITLPKKQFSIYRDMKSETGKYPSMHATMVVPVLVHALDLLGRDDDSGRYYSEFKWYNTLDAKVDKIMKAYGKKRKDLLKDPVMTAEIILDDNSLHSLEYIYDSEKRN